MNGVNKMVIEEIAILNGNIITMDSKIPKCRAVFVKDGKVECIGSDEDIKKKIGEKTKILDVDGKTVLPGFKECHMHFSEFVKSLSKVDLRDCASIEEIKEKLKENIEKKIIIGMSFNDEGFLEKRIPNRKDLDEVSDGIPIIIYRVDLHVCVVNSKALELLGIDKMSKPFEGGAIEKFSNGEPNGILKENAVKMASKLEQKFQSKGFENDLLKASKIAFKYGLTSVSDLLVDWNILQTYRELEKQGKVKLHINTYIIDECLKDEKRLVEELSKGKYVKLRGIKFILDGSLGSKTAALLEGYSGDPKNVGIMRIPYDELESKVIKADQLGVQISLHAIGDKGASYALEVLSKTKRRKQLRHRIEHLQVLNENLINKMKDLDIIAVVQPIFINTDYPWVESRLGQKRIQYAYTLKTLLNKGIKVAGSSDCPVESMNPFWGMYCAVSQRDLEGNPFPEWVKKERVTMKQALTLFTTEAAYATHENSGKLVPGAVADLIILPEDPFKVTLDVLKSMDSLLTIINGKVVYAKKDIFYK
ncbi:amidohydrolase [bacterium]|nr:amidohydrolase [bacterium]MBU4362166.1 amidohydrolase [bacterium]MBU4603013.1 amidohydrolase [bacterium]